MPIAPDGKDTGWLSKFAFQIGALAADSVGREAMADAYFSADATMRAKFADSFITLAKLIDGILSADATGRAKMADNFITLIKLESVKLLYTGVYQYAEYDRAVYA